MRRTVGLTLIFSSALVAALLPSTASADDPSATLRQSSHAWFDGERQSGYLWGGAGVLSLGAAGSLHRFGKGSDIERGMAYPMLGFGLLQALIGVGSLARGDARAVELDGRIARSPEEARRAEVARMRTLGNAFLGIEIFEAVLVVGSVAYAATRTAPEHALSRGVALGLAAEGGAMLLLDSLAAVRAGTYSGQLDAITISVAPAASGQGVSLRGTF